MIIFLKKSYKWLFLLIFLTILDIGTKFWIKSNFFIGEVVYVVPGVNFCYSYNSGLALGLLSNTKMCYRWILVYIIVFVIVMFFCCLYKSIKFNKLYNSLAYSMVIGGALGNLYDRLLYGAVIDFIDFYIGSWHWPIFNIADIEIVIGVLFLITRRITQV